MHISIPVHKTNVNYQLQSKKDTHKKQRLLMDKKKVQETKAFLHTKSPRNKSFFIHKKQRLLMDKKRDQDHMQKLK